MKKNQNRVQKGNSKKPALSQGQTASAPEAPASPEVLAAIAHRNEEASKEAKFKIWNEGRRFPTAVHIAGCRMESWSDVELLHALCESLTVNAGAIRKLVVIPAGPEYLAVAMLEALAIAESVAHQVAFDGRASEPHPVWKEWERNLDFKCAMPMAGLTGRRRVHSARELLEAISAPTFELARKISALVLKKIPDVNRQLELAEALVISEAVENREHGTGDKYDATAGAKLFPGGRPETFLERQARELKFRALCGVEMEE